MNLFAFTTIFAQAGKGLGEFAGDYSSKWDAGTYDGGLVFAGIIKWLVATWGVPEWVPLSSILNGVLEAPVFPEIGALLITIGLVFGFVNIFAIGAVD
ncbi:MAG: hypothetical protein MK554_13885, partial [Planctomycetes bacterium]|nr:hypothetical protein [Planctomycetota bacterium]